MILNVKLQQVHSRLTLILNMFKQLDQKLLEDEELIRIFYVFGF